MVGQFFASFDAFDMVAWAVGVGVFLYALVPIVLSGYCSDTFHMTDDPEAAREAGGDTPTSRRCRELEALGFSPVGRLREVGWFLCPEWRKVCWSSVWTTPDRTIWATVYQLDSGHIGRVTFDSFTDLRSRVYTATPGIGFESEEAKVRRIEGKGPLAEVLDGHRTQAVVFAESREEKVVPVTLEEYEELIANVELSSVSSGPIWIFFQIFWLGPFLACLAVTLFTSLGWSKRIGGSLLAAAGVYFVYARFIFPLLFRHFEEAVLQVEAEEEPPAIS